MFLAICSQNALPDQKPRVRRNHFLNHLVCVLYLLLRTILSQLRYNYTPNHQAPVGHHAVLQLPLITHRRPLKPVRHPLAPLRRKPISYECSTNVPVYINNDLVDIIIIDSSGNTTVFDALLELGHAAIQTCYSLDDGFDQFLTQSTVHAQELEDEDLVHETVQAGEGLGAVLEGRPRAGRGPGFVVRVVRRACVVEELSEDVWIRVGRVRVMLLYEHREVFERCGVYLGVGALELQDGDLDRAEEGGSGVGDRHLAGLSCGRWIEGSVVSAAVGVLIWPRIEGESGIDLWASWVLRKYGVEVEGVREGELEECRRRRRVS
ncbi:hypothetical protein BU23DRAFT_574788 [Bimuria novae-zelandiae CBS 107.79]|uniref:Uncharacterized protein n=1 Tax=Bimuria novae-zelandiae CBS 107.79 TaxID=1447943 RepID=A0A6A5UWW8_9PLEO|nr:hypothetical protein BU23DRAFT_574788 [Bimuria novae-zelandiae CBS 107.79]